MKEIIESLKTTPEHILRARDKAQSLYDNFSTQKQKEFITETINHLSKLHEKSSDEIKSLLK